MPILDLTDEEAQGLVSLLINAMVAANPLLKKVIEQSQGSAPPAPPAGLRHNGEDQPVPLP